MASPKPLQVAVIGGAGGAFFVHPHSRAIHMSGTRRIAFGALSSDPGRALEAAEVWPYPIKGSESWQNLRDSNLNRMGDSERIDYALIVTPNHAHFEPAMAFVKAGVPVFCEKPLTLTVEQARELEQTVREKNVPFAVAHTYLGHWTWRLARHIVRSGLIGDARFVDSYYKQGWLAGRTEDEGVQQAAWRVDPARAGTSCCGGDIGTHAFQSLRYITGLEVDTESAFLETFVEGRQLDDHFTTVCKLSNGGQALVRASQVMIGYKNDHGIEVCGSKGTVVLRQEDSEKLVVYLPGQPDRVYWRGAVSAKDGFLGDLPVDLMAEPALPPGHCEGFHDALARLHGSFETVVRAYWANEPWVVDGSKFATVTDGRIGMEFIEAAVKSSRVRGTASPVPTNLLG